MVDLKSRLERLIDKNKLSECNIGLFSLEFENFEIAKILQNNGLYPKCVINSFDNAAFCNKVRIERCTVEHFAEAYANAVILVNTDDYFTLKDMLCKNGFRINNNVFVDCEVKTSLFFIKIHLKKLIVEIRSIIIKIRDKVKAIRRYLHYIYYQIKGFNVYLKIRAEYHGSNIPIYIYDYSGMGDVYVFCMFLKANYLKISPEGLILTVVGNVSKRVADMFQIENTIKLSTQDSAMLTHLAGLMGHKFNLQVMTPFPSNLHTDIYSHYLYGRKINMAEAYQYVMFNLNDKNIEYPILNEEDIKIKELFAENGLEVGNTIILSPYANTILGYTNVFWSQLAHTLKINGFKICTNCSGREPAVSGTIPLSFPLEIAHKVIEYAGYFIGLRSGFCDVISNTDAFKCVLYPDFYIFNSNVYQFCSLEKMGIGKNYEEIIWDYTDLITLKKVILKKVIYAHIYKTNKEKRRNN